MRPPRPADLPAVLRAAAAAAAEYLASLDDAPAARPVGRVEPEPLAAPVGAVGAIDAFRARYEATLSGSAGPRYWGFVTGGATPAALAGDWLASAYDQNLSSDIGSGASNAEREALAWLRELFELPATFTGALVTGATAANTVALATARQWAGQQVGVDVATDGLVPAAIPRVLAGAAHASIGKALSAIGIGRAALVPVATLPGRQAVDPAALDAALRAGGDRPQIVIGSAGEVNAADFDDLVAVADACARHHAWLHVDGAFGLFARLDPSRAHLVRGVERADSITVDLHKWMNVPYDAGVVWCRHPALQRAVWRASAAYLGDSDDPMHLTPENSRRFRALPLWLTLRAYGRAGIAAWVSRGCALAERLATRLGAIEGVEVLRPASLNVVCFALADPSGAARDRLLAALLESGEVFLSPTVLAGRPAIRAALSSWRTTEADVDRAVTAVARAIDAAKKIVGAV